MSTNDKIYLEELTDISKLNFCEPETDLFKTFGNALMPLSDQQKRDLQEQEEIIRESRREDPEDRIELWSEQDAPSLKELNT